MSDTLPLGIDEWIGVLRSVAGMMSRGDDARLSLERALADQDDRARFRLVMEGDTVTLLRTMEELQQRYGPPPGRRVQELTPEGRLQAQWRTAPRRRR
jgi:hypothetical protein